MYACLDPCSNNIMTAAAAALDNIFDGPSNAATYLPGAMTNAFLDEPTSGIVRVNFYTSGDVKNRQCVSLSTTTGLTQHRVHIQRSSSIRATHQLYKLSPWMAMAAMKIMAACFPPDCPGKFLLREMQVFTVDGKQAVLAPWGGRALAF